MIPQIRRVRNKLKQRKPRPIKHGDGFLTVSNGMIYYTETFENGDMRWLGDNLKDLKKTYNWIGRAISYLEKKHP